MPKYRVLEKSFVNNTLYGPGEPAGDTFDYDGKPGKNWEALEVEDKPKRTRKAKDEPEAEKVPAEEPTSEELA